MAEGTMTNIEIRDFTEVRGVNDTDFVVLSLSDGISARMAVVVFRASVAAGITPSIKDGLWWIGDSSTSVVAEGKTPEFRQGSLGIEWKYTYEPDTAWRLLVAIEDILFTFNELTPEQRDMIKLKFSDLTQDEIAELQKPANDMIAVLEKTNADVAAAETVRITAEEGRVEAETVRAEGERLRMEAESARAEAEEIRKSNEIQRVSSENERKTSEKTRISSENTRIENEDNRISLEEARVEAENKRVEAELSRVSAEDARVKEFATLKAESQAATDDAQDTADHPTYIGDDNYVYKWNKQAKSYDKTAIYVRGEAFSIKKVYASVSEMIEDTSTSFKEGDFCLINTNDVENPDNAKLYVRSEVGSWDFLVDMSGAIGFTGKTPQLLIGTVSVGSGKDSAAVTVTPDGTDTDGNPKYRINYVIPCLAYEDLTPEQIAELQRPASDMIEQLQATDESVKQSEAARVAAEDIRQASEERRILSEDSRIAAEQERGEAEQDRKEAENLRAINEDARVLSESERQEAETDRREAEEERKTSEEQRNSAEDSRALSEQARREAEDIRKEAENLRVTNEETRVLNESERQEAETNRREAEEERAAAESVRRENEEERVVSETSRKENYTLIREGAVVATRDATLAAQQARNLPKIQDGTWWLYDVEQGVYVDSGYSVSSDFQLTKGKIENVFTGDISTHTHSHLIYYAQVYSEQPDFSTLTSWTDGEGIVHEYVTGNDIYVADTDEPTGYANYKLAHTSNGNKWVKIPQVPDGYGTALVKKD